MSIDWCTAIGGALIGWVASSKVEEAQQSFATTISRGSAEGVKAAWKQAAKKAAKKAQKAQKAKVQTSAGVKTGKNG